MADTYVTLNEAAELESIGYDTMKKKNPQKSGEVSYYKGTEGDWWKGNDNGGNLIPIQKGKNSLEGEGEAEKAVAEAPVQEADQAEDTPWYVEEDIDWYIENHKNEWYKAMELKPHSGSSWNMTIKGRTEFAESFAQERLGKGKRTLYRYTKSYMEASAWADKLHKEDGGNYDFFKVLCLCRKPKEAGTFPSFKPEVRQAIKNIWFNETFAQNQGTKGNAL